MTGKTTNKWPLVLLADILSERRETPDPAEMAAGKIRIVSKIAFNKGEIELRDSTETKTKMITIMPGDLVLSGINAAKGAIAIYPSKESDKIAATIHYSAYKVNLQKASIKYLWWLLRSNTFRDILFGYIPGGIKTELKAKRFLPIAIPLPSLDEQKYIVKRIESLATKINKARNIEKDIASRGQSMLLSAFHDLTCNSPKMTMSEVAPLQRRPVSIQMDFNYPELGVRSYGNGTFHKPSLLGHEVGSKKLYSIEPGDLVFSNVFAWEGAIAVAKPKDIGRYGSHRFITRVPNSELATAEFLRFYFLTNEGLEKIGEASPGGAGRNRTLGLKKLDAIEVPIPPLNKQKWFDGLQQKWEAVQLIKHQRDKELNALMPSVLDKAFKGEL